MFRHTTVFLCSGCGLVGGINRRASCAGIPPSARPLFSVVYSCLTWLCAACISSILCHFHTCSYDIILRLLEQGRTAKKKQAFFFRGGRVVPTSNHSPPSFFWYRTYTRTRTLELPRWEVSEAFKSSTSSRVSPSFSLFPTHSAACVSVCVCFFPLRSFPNREVQDNPWKVFFRTDLQVCDDTIIRSAFFCFCKSLLGRSFTAVGELLQPCLHPHRILSSPGSLVNECVSQLSSISYTFLLPPPAPLYGYSWVIVSDCRSNLLSFTVPFVLS